MEDEKIVFTNWFGPVLDALRELGGSGKPREVSNLIAERENVNETLLEEEIKSGQSRFYNQVAWARQYLVWEGLLDASKRGTWALTPNGSETFLSHDQAKEIASKWISIKARSTAKDETEQQILEEQEYKSPENAEIDSDSDLLSILKKLTPNGFERVCQRLLRESGFENVYITGKSHDGGIDGYGVLEINPFVSFKVLFQCKRYQGTVSRAQVGDFRNAMIGRAEKGIILTTGTFSKDAEKEANRDGAPAIELVDGKKLVEMFERVELGLKPKTVYDIDLSFFEQFMKD